MSNRVFHVAFAGGGTGGHLVPGLAIARELQRRTPCSVTFLTTGKDVERRLLEPTNHRTRVIPAVPPGHGLVQRARFALKSALGLITSWRYHRQHKPDCVVSLGGYGAFTPALAAHLQGIPVVCLEQNAIAGKVTRLLSRFAHTVFTQWLIPDTQLTPRARQLAIGNPVRADLFDGDREDGIARFGLDPSKRTLVVMGGSQGARALNNFVLDNLATFDKFSRHAQVLLVTGAGEYERVRCSFPLPPPWLQIVPFTNSMPDLLATADLVVCRAGATTIAELAAVGKPMVLVPYPHAAEKHQHANARRVVNAGAALWYEEDGLNGELLEFLLQDVLLNDWNRLDLAGRARLMGKPTAAERVAREVVRLMNETVAAVPAASTLRWLQSGRFASVTLNDAELLDHTRQAGKVVYGKFDSDKRKVA